MLEKKISGLVLRFFETLSLHQNIGHFVSTRIGGYSSPPYHSLNLGFDVGDDPENVIKNRRVLAKAIQIPVQHLTTTKQVHGCQVKIVSHRLRGKGSINDREAIEASDAMVTNVKNNCLMVLLADCLPVMLYDPRRMAVGIVHAGWRGTLCLITRKTVQVFVEAFGSVPEDILAGLGPSIGPCCYQVGSEIISQMGDVLRGGGDCITNRSADGRGYLDLWKANLGQLVQAGVPERNIELARLCTCDHTDLFFSHRYEKGKTGRFGAGIFIR